MRTLMLTALVLLSACREKDNTDDSSADSVAVEVDADGDGSPFEEDCDDNDPSAFPGATEACDGVDNNCDGAIDEGLGDTWYADRDADGFGDPESSEQACEQPSGAVADSSDCDDSQPDVNPDGIELCDGLDNDCDGEVDNDTADAATWYADGDGDGYGVDNVTMEACDTPPGFAAQAGDCDDQDVAFNPGAAESDCADPNDYNCDGSVGYADDDGDGYAACEECDDGDRGVNPSATEVCDGVDNNCDGTVDEDSAANAATWYSDSDGDSYGDASASAVSCDAPNGYVSDSSDCDDGNAGINPGATEVCDGADNDCDGSNDEGVTSTWYPDSDGDSYGAPSGGVEDCSAPSGHVADNSDCDDGDASANPGATEVCDSVDNNCDGTVDEGVTSTWYVDYDSDGYGSTRITREACTQPSNFVADSSDCDDTVAAINPGATEICDSLDNDCDSLIDDDDSDLDTSTGSTWYSDSDGDGYGDPNSSFVTCAQPSATVTNTDDCDDTEPLAWTGAAEVCDGVDNDCDGNADTGALGGAAQCAAIDCDDVLANVSTAPDGNYWIDPDSSGAPFEIFCDMSNDGGGWTLVANVDDINDPWLTAQSTTWETTDLRNEGTLPSYSTDIAVTSKYRSWTSMPVSDLRIAYKNDGAYFLCEGLDVVDTLDVLFATPPSRAQCASVCTSFSTDRLVQGTTAETGINCSDANEGWINTSSPNGAENSRIGGISAVHPSAVTNGYLGAAGDRGYSTSYYEKTWGDYSNGVISDNNIMVFVR